VTENAEIRENEMLTARSAVAVATHQFGK